MRRALLRRLAAGLIGCALLCTTGLAAGQVKHTQHDPGHFEIALALAEFVAGK